MSKELTQKLRNAVHVQCSRQGADYTKVERLLAAGADPGLRLSAKQVSILEEVCNPRSPTRYGPSNRCALLSLFVKYGANPLSFPDYMREIVRTGMHAQTVRALLQAISEKVEGQGVPSSFFQDAKGRNLLAVLTQDSDSWGTLKSILEGQSSVLWKMPCVKAWHHEVDGEGRNLANLLVCHAMKCFNPPLRLWPVLEVVAKNGIDLHQADHEGQTAATRLVSLLEREDLTPQIRQAAIPLLAHLSQAQQSLLDQSTPQAPLNAPGRRM